MPAIFCVTAPEDPGVFTTSFVAFPEVTTSLQPSATSLNALYASKLEFTSKFSLLVFLIVFPLASYLYSIISPDGKTEFSILPELSYK
ncbi:hypothetical protein D3C75_1075850 [compost metagenome]